MAGRGPAASNPIQMEQINIYSGKKAISRIVTSDSLKDLASCLEPYRSIYAIIDGNVTTLIGAIVLWIVGSSTIQGFAVTLFIGIILSMFTSLVVTRLILSAFLPLTAKLDKKRPGINAKLYALKRAEKVEEGK